MILRILSILLLLSTSTCNLNAQEVEEVMRSISQLEKEKNKFLLENDSISKTNDSIRSLYSEKEKQLSDLQKDFNLLSRNLDPKKIKLLEDKLNELVENDGKLSLAVRRLNNEKSKQKNALDDTRREIGDLGVYASIRLDRLYNSNINDLARKYSEISNAELKDLEASASELSNHKDYVIYTKRLEFVRANHKIYEEAVLALKESYNEVKVKSIRSELKPLLNLKADDASNGRFMLSEQQFVEFDSLDIRLSRFKNGIKAFQKLISDINADERIKKFRDSNDQAFHQPCIDVLKEYFSADNSERNKVVERYFNEIPYLLKAYNKYKNELHDDPLSVTSIESEILQYNIQK